MSTMHFAYIAVVAGVVTSCGSATEPSTPTVVPAGAADAQWAAIGKSCAPTSSVYSVARARLDSAPALTHGPIRSVDDDWSDVAREVPGGWAGVILESGTPVIFLVDTTKGPQAISALQARGTIQGLNLSGARVRPARWNFTQLAEWYRYLQLHVPFGPVIFSSDIDESKNRIAYGVPGAAERAAAEQILATLDLPCYLVALEQGSPYTVH